MKIIDTLFEGNLDIIGDIHGEIKALESLLIHLGYGEDGSHPDDRNLVFVGDLVDRGPDSPAVVECVMKLVKSGHAQCILGNHELNLLLDEQKEGNEWFFDTNVEKVSDMESATTQHRKNFPKFFAQLPIVLKRDDLRIVHACWNDNAISRIEEDQRNVKTLRELHRQYKRQIEERLQDSEHLEKYEEEVKQYGSFIEFKGADPEEHWPNPIMLHAHAKKDETWQMNNPVRVLTSGEERQTQKPFAAGGKFRFVERVPWWKTYDNEISVVVGHYWRRFNHLTANAPGKFGPDLLEGIEPHHWMGKRNNVYCIDFSVGARASERANGKSGEVHRLAALRWPEKEVLFDDGHKIQTQ
jgi:hypothetical protein